MIQELQKAVAGFLDALSIEMKRSHAFWAIEISPKTYKAIDDEREEDLLRQRLLGASFRDSLGGFRLVQSAEVADGVARVMYNNEELAKLEIES